MTSTTGITKSQPASIVNWLKPTILLFICTPLSASATVQDDIFKQYVSTVCVNRNTPLPGWNAAAVTQLCNIAFPLIITSPPPPTTVTSNLGANAGAGLSSRIRKGIPINPKNDKGADKGASADDNKWGLLVTPQYGNGSRSTTELENGYESTLSGINFGLDYRHSDQFVTGAILGHTQDSVQYLNAAGSLKTTQSALTVYGTWLPSDSVSVDGYLGYGSSNLDSQRKVVLFSINGTTRGSTSATHSMAGISISHQQNFGQVNFSPFFNLDYANSHISSYNETGSTLLELHHIARSITSVTSSIGGRFGSQSNYQWGAIQPSVRLAAVHEFKNKTRYAYSELVSTPGTGFVIATDAPDCNYLNFGLGMAATLNNGAQLFLDFEKRTQDRLLKNWALNLGALVEF